MQTFITFRNFSQVASGLDMPRLGKQRSETLQILRALRHEAEPVGNPWPYKMWEGYEEALVFYGLIITHEWRIVRKLADNTWGEFAELAHEYGMIRVPEMVKEQVPVKIAYPPWMGEDWILRSHRSQLVEKMPAHYGPMFPATPINLPYLWPVFDETHRHGYRLFVSKADLVRLERDERRLPRNIQHDKETGEVVVKY